MGDVIKFGGLTKLDIPVNDVLGGAIEAGLKSAVVLGYDKEGDLYFSSSTGSPPDMLWLIESFRKFILEGESPDWDK